MKYFILVTPVETMQLLWKSTLKSHDHHYFERQPLEKKVSSKSLSCNFIFFVFIEMKSFLNCDKRLKIQAVYHVYINTTTQPPLSEDKSGKIKTQCVGVFRKINYFLRSDKQLSFPEDAELQYGLLKSSVILTVAAFLISLWHLYGIIF